MDFPTSPLFPAELLALPTGALDNSEYLLPQLPEHPVALTLSLQVYLVPTEKHLFVQGFKPSEYEGVPPTLLRGCLVLRVLKPTRIRSISLLFKGIQRTDWPEGIPPKKNVYLEANDIIAHTWPFYQMENPLPNCGADFYVPKGHEEISHLNLSELHPQTTLTLAPIDSATSFAANLIKRATSPLPGASGSSLAPSDSMADLSAVLSSLSIHTTSDKPGQFEPGDYVYNFEHPIPALSPETTLANFGKVAYFLETTIARIGTFKANLVGKIPVEVIRIPSENSVEENEPIVIERDWEDQLRYEIVVGSKSVVLDSYVPLVFRFIPLYGKVALHRIRVYLTENCNYYCSNKTVHREEPVKKFLLLEHKAKKNKSLLLKSGGMTDEVIEDDEVLPREVEFQMYVPSMINKKYNYCIHPDTSFDNIKCDHWIKISLRISKQDPNIPDKRKHFEISIDSPIHLCSPLAAHCNTLLPAYDMEPEFLPKYTLNSPPMSPEVTAIDYSHHNGHLILSALSPFGGNTTTSNSSTPPRATTPIEFQHITSSENNDEPIERDNNLHLEANLYQPEEAEVLDAIGSPQARPFLPVRSPQARPFSPVRSPSARPHGLGLPSVNSMNTAPSMEPPLFELVGEADGTLPPAYFRDDPALSLSPLRIDQASEGRRLRSNTASRTVPGIAVLDIPATSIKSMLNKQLDRRERSDSVRSTPSANSKKSGDSDDKLSLSSKRLQSSKKSEERKEDETESSQAKANEQTKEEAKENEGKEADRRDHDLTPVTVPVPIPIPKISHSRDLSGSSFPRLPVSSPARLPNSRLHQSPIIGSHDDDFDIADIRTENLTGHHLRVDNIVANSRKSSVSRRSSILLTSLADAPLDQTLPLLSQSTSTVNEAETQFDYGRRQSLFGSMSDLVDVSLFGHDDFSVNGSLFTLRNPRIKKHYQEEATEEADPEEYEKPRQKSFGVLPQVTQLQEQSRRSRGLTESSEESETTVDAIESPNASKNDTLFEPVDLQEVASR